MRRDGRPHVMPVWFVLDGDDLLFTTHRDTVSEDLDELRRWATVIGGRYMGADRAEEFGARNGVPGEMLVRVRIEKLLGEDDVAGYGSR